MYKSMAKNKIPVSSDWSQMWFCVEYIDAINWSCCNSNTLSTQAIITIEWRPDPDWDAVHTSILENLSKPQQCCKVDWAQILGQLCGRRMASLTQWAPKVKENFKFKGGFHYGNLLYASKLWIDVFWLLYTFALFHLKQFAIFSSFVDTSV